MSRWLRTKSHAEGDFCPGRVLEREQGSDRKQFETRKDEFQVLLNEL
jgi:hypothetical protein